MEDDTLETQDQLEGRFWKGIRQDLITAASCDISVGFLPLVTDKIKTMGPKQLMELWLSVYENSFDG